MSGRNLRKLEKARKEEAARKEMSQLRNEKLNKAFEIVDQITEAVGKFVIYYP